MTLRDQPAAIFRRAAVSRQDVTVEMSADPVAIGVEWRQFEAHAIGSLYQTWAWCSAWMETVGTAWEVQPLIVRGHCDGETLFLMPLQIRRRQGVKVLEWLGAPHLGYGFPMLDPAFAAEARGWFAKNLDKVFHQLPAHDAISLADNPHRLLGVENPLSPAFNLKGANQSFAMRLQPDFAALHAAKKSAARRRTARKNENALAQSGTPSFGLPETAAETHALLDVMFRNQEQRLAELGIHGVFGDIERRFVHRLADIQDKDRPILAPYALSQNGEVLAVMLGGLHANVYWALISSLAPGPQRRHSPGDAALTRTIAACCERGLAMFDFSPGDADYKRLWADEVIDLSVILKARSYRGLAWCVAMTARTLGKRLIKTTPWLHAKSKTVRRTLFGLRR